jgi:hypothetical protein
VSELSHFLVEKSGVTVQECAVFAVVFAYVMTGMLVALGIHVSGVRPLRACAALSAIFLMGLLPGLYLFPKYLGGVMVTALFPSAVYVYSCHMASRVDRL